MARLRRLLPKYLPLSSPRTSLTLTLIRSLHNSIPKSPDSSFTVSYLTGSCGLSLSTALSAAKDLRLLSTSNADAVLALLKSHGFTKTQLASAVAKRPNLLSASPDMTIRPKLNFFLSVTGLSAKVLAADPQLLLHSLDKRLIPNFNILSSVLGSDKAVTAIANSSWLLRDNLQKGLLPKIKILQEIGLPGPMIVKLTTHFPRVMMQNFNRFVRTVEKVKNLGFDPSSTMFILGITAISGLNASTWERKQAIYRSMGWTEEETVSAFKKYPYCMLTSDKKIREGMDFFMKTLHLEPSFLSLRPKLLSLSMEKRIIPRCSVMNILASRGLVSKKLGLHTFLFMPEKEYLEQYVIKHLAEVPELLEAHQGKVDFVGVDKRK